MTKKEIVTILVNEYGVEEKGLMRKTVKELEDLLSKAKEESIMPEEEEKEANQDGIESGGRKPENEPEEIVSEVQLNIYETVVRRFKPAKNLRIENLGAGDVYVGESQENLIQRKNKIVPGQGVYLTNVSVLYITSASRPIIRIIH